MSGLHDFHAFAERHLADGADFKLEPWQEQLLAPMLDPDWRPPTRAEVEYAQRKADRAWRARLIAHYEQVVSALREGRQP